jgi:hypothetical protein
MTAKAPPEAMAPPMARGEDRSLETSTTLLADFFNGQVIDMESTEDA